MYVGLFLECTVGLFLYMTTWGRRCRDVEWQCASVLASWQHGLRFVSCVCLCVCLQQKKDGGSGFHSACFCILLCLYIYIYTHIYCLCCHGYCSHTSNIQHQFTDTMKLLCSDIGLLMSHTLFTWIMINVIHHLATTLIQPFARCQQFQTWGPGWNALPRNARCQAPPSRPMATPRQRRPRVPPRRKGNQGRWAGTKTR